MYILRCGDGSLYVGSTRHLLTRLDQHAIGKGAKYTSTRLPVELVYAEEFESIADAYAREKQVQGWSRKKREAIIAREFDALPGLSKKRF